MANAIYERMAILSFPRKRDWFCCTRLTVTYNPVADIPALSCVLVSGSEGKQGQWLQVFRDLYAVEKTSEHRGVIVLIKHSDLHCRFGIVWGKAAVFCVNCQNKQQYWYNSDRISLCK